MTTVTLVDGREVDSYSAEWRIECLRVHEFVKELGQVTSRAGRAEMLARIHHEQGVAMADRVSRAFTKAFEDAKAAARAAVSTAKGDA